MWALSHASDITSVLFAREGMVSGERSEVNGEGSESPARVAAGGEGEEGVAMSRDSLKGAGDESTSRVQRSPRTRQR